MKTEKLMIAGIKEDIESINKAVSVLNYSLKKCTKISIKVSYTIEELDAFENLTSRFARTSDIYTQKIMKGIILILREDARTFLDRANLFEKLNITDAEELKLIRDLRNEISHEYRLSDVSEIFESVLEYSVKLLRIIEKTIVFAQDKGWFDDGDAELRQVHQTVLNLSHKPEPEDE
jgi:uncharacterized protein YutE (UPF0331/DUF86 family)